MVEWFQDFARTDLAHHLLVATVIVVVLALSSRLVRAILRFLAHRIFRHTENLLDDRITEVLLKYVRPLMLVTGFNLGVREIRKAVEAGHETFAQILDYSEDLLYIAAVWLAARILIGVVREIIAWYMERMSEGGPSDISSSLGPLIRKSITFVVGVVALTVVLEHFSVNIGSLLVSLGVGSLAVALAAQDTLANMIAGFVIMIDRPFRVGDRVELPTGQVGDVQKIGLRSTKFLDFDNNVIVMPNAELTKGRLVNLAYPTSEVRVLLRLGVAYGTDPERVRKLLLGIAGAHPGVLAAPEPKVYCTALGESSVEFTLVGRTEDYRQRYDVETALREQAYQRCAQEGIVIPFPQRVVTMGPAT
jgi:small-conductance mechanosensitive channel